MKILIVEDETVAYENLVEILAEVAPEAEVVGNTESVRQTVRWLQTKPKPDLLLMDIHLSDGSSFAIFDIIQVETPIIFTTAYDQYALDAFRVNSIDYLLKPIKPQELRRALDKYSRFSPPELLSYLARLGQLSTSPEPKYKDKLLIPFKDKLLPIGTSEIACFYTTDKSTQLFLRDGRSYPFGKTLDQVMPQLNPAHFQRANKQFIVARESVKDLTIWFDNRLLVTLDVEVPERIYVSKNKASEFKSWIAGES